MRNVLSSKMSLCRSFITSRQVLPITKCVSRLHVSSQCLKEAAESAESDSKAPRYTNVSGLRPHLRERMRHVNATPGPDPTIAYAASHLRPKHRRKLYAKHGAASGVNPGLMWPSKEELGELKSLDEEFEPSLQELWAKVAEKREAQQAARSAREAAVMKGMAAMPKYIADHKARLHRTEKEEVVALAKQQELMDEARDFYGYEISRSDPRFILMVEQKEEEAKQAKKQKRKDDKETSVKRVLSELTKKRARTKKPAASADDED